MDDNFEYDIEKDKEINKDNEFNPIKEQIGGKSAERVIWSTYSINKAVEALKKGLPLKANPFIGKNTKLLRADLVYKRTEEELEDYMRCMEDPIYFASKCFLMTPEGLQACKLRDYQDEYINRNQLYNKKVRYFTKKYCIDDVVSSQKLGLTKWDFSVGDDFYNME